MKKALFWTIRKGYTGRFYLMEVTTESGRRYWGRDQFGDATNARRSDCRGRFESKDQALAVINTAQAIEDEYRARIKEHDKAITALRNERDDKIADAVAAVKAA